MSPLLRIAGAAILALGGMGKLYAALPMSGFEDCPVVADSELDEMRGGFETSSGGLPLSFSLGIVQAIYKNGELESTTTIAIPNLTSALNAQGAGATAINPAINVIQNGAGNVVALSSIQNMPAYMTFIQNSLDNQSIGIVTTINASVTSRDFLRSLAVQTSLNQMNFKSVH